jgi:hypothetical protein
MPVNDSMPKKTKSEHFRVHFLGPSSKLKRFFVFFLRKSYIAAWASGVFMQHSPAVNPDPQ